MDTCGGYNPSKESSSYFISQVSNALDKFIVNTTMCDETMKDFCQTYSLHNLINEPTCEKNANNPSSRDVILTNRKRGFHNSMAIETDHSNIIIITILKSYFQKKHRVTINYRSKSSK